MRRLIRGVTYLIGMALSINFLIGCAQGPVARDSTSRTQLSDGNTRSIVASHNANMHLLDRYLQQGQVTEAAKLVEQLWNTPETWQKLTFDQQFELLAFKVELLARFGQQKPFDLLESLPYSTDAQLQRANLLLSEVHGWTGDYFGEISVLYQLDKQSRDADRSIQQRMWDKLKLTALLPITDFETIEPPELRGWWELARASQRATSTAAMVREYATWAQLYPDHPAASSPPFTASLRHPSLDELVILLPRRGQLSIASDAIRHGIMMAYFEDSSKRRFMPAPRVRFVDVDSTPVKTQVLQAFEAGASAVVGLIDKQNVESVLAIDQLPGPMLALNRVEGQVPSSPEVKQFSFVVTDESNYLAKELVRRGLERVVLFSCNHSWAQRARASFLNSMDSEKILANVVFASPDSIISSVADGLAVTASQERHAELERILQRTIVSEDRRRQDIDAIVAFVDESEVETFLAALRYHFASDIPLFLSESAIRSGLPVDVPNGTVVTGTTWLVDENLAIEDALEQLGLPRTALSLITFGADAYRLINRWDELQANDRVIGAGGIYEEVSQGVIHREPILGTVFGSNLQPTRSVEIRPLSEYPLIKKPEIN